MLRARPGASVTQATSKSTAVTCDSPCGIITMNAASLAATTSVAFVLNNVLIASGDVIIVNVASGATTGSYGASVELISAGSCRIHLRNVTAGALAEAVVLNFVVIKAN